MPLPMTPPHVGQLVEPDSSTPDDEEKMVADEVPGEKSSAESSAMHVQRVECDAGSRSPIAMRPWGTRRGRPWTILETWPRPHGKVPADLLARALATHRPLPPEVRVGPGVGEDVCAIHVDAGAPIVATDPITLTTSELGRYAVLVNANDVAVMGVRPRWFLAANGNGNTIVEFRSTEISASVDSVRNCNAAGCCSITAAAARASPPPRTHRARG